MHIPASLGERETRSPLGKKTCNGMGESRFRVTRRPRPAFLLPEGEGQDEGEEASNAQAAFCFLRTHWLGFTHYKRRGFFHIRACGSVGAVWPPCSPSGKSSSSISPRLQLRMRVTSPAGMPSERRNSWWPAGWRLSNSLCHCSRFASSKPTSSNITTHSSTFT